MQNQNERIIVINLTQKKMSDEEFKNGGINLPKKMQPYIISFYTWIHWDKPVNNYENEFYKNFVDLANVVIADIKNKYKSDLEGLSGDPYTLAVKLDWSNPVITFPLVKWFNSLGISVVHPIYNTYDESFDRWAPVMNNLFFENLGTEGNTIE